jgi:hypothetical protein
MYEYASGDWRCIAYTKANGEAVVGGGAGGGGFTFSKVTGTGTASSGDEIGASTSGSAYTYNLPSSPSGNDRVRFIDIDANWNTNNLTIGRNSSTIRGVSADYVADVDNAWLEFVYNGTDATWEILTQ